MAKIVRKNGGGGRNDAMFLCEDLNRFVVLNNDLKSLEDILVPCIVKIYNDLDDGIDISDIDIPDDIIQFKFPVYPIADVNSEDSTDYEMECSHGTFPIIFDLDKWYEIWTSDASFKERIENSTPITPMHTKHRFQNRFMEYGFENVSQAMNKPPVFAQLHIEAERDDLYVVIKYFGPKIDTFCAGFGNNKAVINLHAFIELAHYGKRHPVTNDFIAPIETE